MARALRGLEQNQEQNYSQLLRDTRTVGQRIRDFFRNSFAVAMSLVFGAVAGVFFPALTEFIFMFGVLFFLIGLAVTRKLTLPFRMPQRCGEPDYNDPAPGSNKPRKARGIYFLGNEIKTKEELWFANDDMRTHMLVFGSTGSGKTEALVSIAYNALIQGSGFIYVDGKGDNSLFAKVFSMVRSMGREDDMLLINFMTGARDIIGPQKSRLSNTMNPFANGSSSMLSQLVVSLMDSGSSGGDGDMWKGRAVNFVESLMKVLVAMRDAGHILLDANTIRNYFHLERIEAMVIDKVFIRDDQDPINIEYLPPLVIEPIKNYLLNLPGYNKEKKGKQVSQVLEQHGFITMQLTKVFGSLSDTYSHIMRTNLAEVDLKDVVLNRRILVVLLPALEKSPDELSNLGKVIIASLKAMMAAGLGDAVEGDYRDVIQRKPTNSLTPYLCILDEYGYYAVKGFAVVPAQARSLGFSVVFAGQDLPAFQKASKEEALSIGANTNIKICMKLEDPLDTWDFFMKTAGESYVTSVKEFQNDATKAIAGYMDSKSAQVEKRARVDLLDLKEQREGEAHIFFKSKIVRAKMFYANPEIVPHMRLNQFLKIETPPDSVLAELSKVGRSFENIMNSGDIFASIDAIEDDLGIITNAIINGDGTQSAIERGVAALLAFHSRVLPEQPAEEELLPEIPQTELNLFTPLRVSDHIQHYILVKDINTFGAPFLEPITIRENMINVERLLGRGEVQAISIGTEILKDMQQATHYPPDIEDNPMPEELSDLISNLLQHIVLRKTESKAEA
ncbi:MAG TPA: TraM recognition domain-containing protein [Gammaproteobacteria bacterium]|nr:TraM recognition domain-containing protein [Gammaproteobacteria bacterium]